MQDGVEFVSKKKKIEKHLTYSRENEAPVPPVADGLRWDFSERPTLSTTPFIVSKKKK